MKTVLVACALVGLVASQTGYTGVWYRDSDLSDDAESKIDTTVDGFIEKMSKGKTSTADVDPRFVKRLRGVLETFVQYADELSIERTRGELVVDDGGETLRIYYIDERKHERQMLDGTRLETTATQTGGQIDIEMKTSDGAKIFETYTLASGGDELVLLVRLEDKQLKQPLEIRNVYTRADY